MHASREAGIDRPTQRWAICLATVAVSVPGACTAGSAGSGGADNTAPAAATAALAAGHGHTVAPKTDGTLPQWGLHRAALLTPMMVETSLLLGGPLLVAAGVYQWVPLKDARLAKCCSSLGFLLTKWCDGARGVWIMDVRHGGCCWALMAELFVGGVMNLLGVVGFGRRRAGGGDCPGGRPAGALGRADGASGLDVTRPAGTQP